MKKFGIGKASGMIASAGKLAELIRKLGDADKLLILTHNNPDPDSIASAYGLRHILSFTHRAKVRIGYHGTIGRSENRHFVKLLKIPLHEVTAGQASRYKNIAIVDSSPDAKNVLKVPMKSVRIVIDHHLSKKMKTGAEDRFQDLRPAYGATSTIIAEYIKENGIPLNARVATALYYGIKTDIGDRGRGHTAPDIEMTQFLFPKISIRWLWRIEKTPIPPEYFMYYGEALNRAFVAGDVIVSDLGEVKTPDAIAEMADFLLKVEGPRWSLCIGRQGDRLYFSIRTTRKGQRMGDLAYRLAGRKGSAGGHEQSAGGFIPLEGFSPDQTAALRKDLAQRFFSRVGRDYSQAVPFLVR